VTNRFITIVEVSFYTGQYGEPFAAHEVLRFTTDLAVAFSNNLAERRIRPAKVQQRSSGGCWRTLQGLADYAVVQSYLTTAAAWGVSRLDALRSLFTTGPWIPTALSPEITAA
jgi:transposase